MKPILLHPESYKGTYKPVGGHLVLDFVNTVSYRGFPKPHDWLSRFTNLSMWARAIGLVGAPEETGMNNWAKAHPLEAGQQLEDIKNLRERLYRLLRKIHSNGKCPSRDLKAFNEDLSRTFQRQELVQWDDGTQRRLKLEWRSGIQTAELIQSEIIKSAFALMTSEKMLSTMKTCEGCDWLFLDRSQAKRRRWCTMEDCGNRAKAKRFYRQKAGKS
nr:ABATE domain-containing protein [uncultured Desulfobacter sp.]